jgi:hypothetical protein
MNRQHLSFVLITVYAALNGCSGTTAFLNREIQENEIEVGAESNGAVIKASVMGMSENRRGILIRQNKQGIDPAALAQGQTVKPEILFCAEPPPDVAVSSKAGFAAGLAVANKGKADVTDSYARQAMQLANRTSLLDIYRTAVFSLCQLHMNGAISDVDTAKMFSDITLKALEKAPTNESPNAGRGSDANSAIFMLLPTTEDEKANEGKKANQAKRNSAEKTAAKVEPEE